MLINSNAKLFSNFLSLSIVQVINFLVPLLLIPYVISRIGIEAFGVIAVAQVLMIYLSTIADYGFNLTATKEVALHKDNRGQLSRIFFTVLASRLFISAILLIILLLVIPFIPWMQKHFVLLALGFTYVIGQSLFVNWLFQGIEKMHFITACSLVSRLIFVILVLLFIHQKADAKYFLFFLGTGNLAAGILSIAIGWQISQLRYQKPKLKEILAEIRSGWQITVSNLSINTFLYSGIFILRIFTNDAVVGYYSVAERIFFAARQVLAVFSQVIYPRICLFGRSNTREGQVFFRKIFLPFLLATIAGSLLMFVFAPQIIAIFIKDGSQVPVLLLRIFSVVPLIVCLNIPAYQLLLAYDQTKSYMKVYALATVLNIIANIFLVNTWGAVGTVISVIITEIFITAGLNQQLYKNKLAGFLLAGSR